MAQWKYGVSFAEQSPMTAPLPLAGDLYENMDKAVELGYDGIEFHTREFFEFDEARLAQTKAELCMLVTGRLYTQGHHGMLDEDPESVKCCMDGMKTYLNKAAKLGAGIVLGWAKGVVAPGKDREETLALLGKRLKELNDYGKEVGAPIVVEVINHYETNIFNTTAETLAFLERYDLDNCYLHLDTYHMNIEECDPYAAIRLAGKRLGYFHVADNSRRYPGSGQLDFKRLLAALKEIDYRGWVTVECIPEPDRETAAKLALAHLMQCE